MRVVKRDCPDCGYEQSRMYPATLVRLGAVCTPSRLMTLGYPMFTHPDRALGLNLFFTLQWVLLLALLIWPAFLLAAFVRLCQSTVRTHGGT
jgi:hypothetical protein